jgi:dolichol-phosphate mannosyltransferase
MPEVAIVVPVYNEEEVLRAFLSRVKEILSNLEIDFEILLCVDPSTDKTSDVIRDVCNDDVRIRALFMSRRFGQPACTFAGLEHSRSDAVIVMDCDFQDPPEVIPLLLTEWRKGSLLVRAQRRSRSGEFYTRTVIARFGYFFLNRFSSVPIPKNSGDFRLMDKRIVNEVLRFKEANHFLRGIATLVGFKESVVYFERKARPFGKSKYSSALGSLKIGFDGVLGFSTSLLKFSGVMGLLFSLMAFLFAVSYALFKILGYNFPIGNPTIVITILMLGGLQLLSIGILGLYIGHIHEEVKRRPRYIIESTLNVD